MCSESSVRKNSATCVSQFYRRSSSSRVTNTARERHAIPPACHLEFWCHWRSFRFKFHSVKIVNWSTTEEKQVEEERNLFEVCIFVFFLLAVIREDELFWKREENYVTLLVSFIDHSAHHKKCGMLCTDPVGICGLFTFRGKRVKRDFELILIEALELFWNLQENLCETQLNFWCEDVIFFRFQSFCQSFVHKKWLKIQ